MPCRSCSSSSSSSSKSSAASEPASRKKPTVKRASPKPKAKAGPKPKAKRKGKSAEAKAQTEAARRQRAQERREEAAKAQRESNWRAREGLGFLESLPRPSGGSTLPLEWVEERGGAETHIQRSRAAAHNALGLEVSVVLLTRLPWRLATSTPASQMSLPSMYSYKTLQKTWRLPYKTLYKTSETWRLPYKTLDPVFK